MTTDLMIWVEQQAERAVVDWVLLWDPTTAPDAVEYAVAADPGDLPGTGWVAGTWDSYTTATGVARSWSPTLGGTAASITLTAGTTYALWGRVTRTSTGEVVVRRCQVAIRAT